MNDMAKNLILWLIIAAVLVTVMNNFSSPNEPQTLNYSDFIQQVKDGKVERVTVDGEEIVALAYVQRWVAQRRPEAPTAGVAAVNPRELVSTAPLIEHEIDPQRGSVNRWSVVAPVPAADKHVAGRQFALHLAQQVDQVLM